MSFDTKFRYKATTDRVAHKAVTNQTASMIFTDGVNSSTFDFGGNGWLSKVDDDLPLDNAAYQAVGHTSAIDPTSLNLITYAQTPKPPRQTMSFGGELNLASRFYSASRPTTKALRKRPRRRLRGCAYARYCYAIDDHESDGGRRMDQ